LSLSPFRPSENLTNSGLFDLNKINVLKLNMSGPKWTASENIRSLESENSPRYYTALDRFAEKSPDIIGM